MELLRLRTTFHRFQFRENRPQQSALIQQIETAESIPRCQNLYELVADSFRADLVGARGSFHDCVPRRRIDFESKDCCESNRSQHPQPVLSESLSGITDCANNLCLQIGLAADEVDHVAGDRVKKHPVDSEIPPSCVFLGR